MKLSELDPQFIRHHSQIDTWPVRNPDGSDGTVTAPRVYLRHVDALAEAQGVEFLCPVCFLANGGRPGTHSILCWSRSRGAPDDASPGPGRWALSGSGYDDLTLTGDNGASNSVHLTSPQGCGAHFYVTNGEIILC